VGSLSAGGAGKTPVVLMLAELLGSLGLEVRVLTRGYGRKGRAVERVSPDGDAALLGDEPLLLARRLPHAAIYVGGDRYRAGRLAGRKDTAATRAVYLLDDGFQHRKLARDVDVVLITQRDMDDRLLPAGNLREPLKALMRADIVIVREEETGVAALIRTELAGRPCRVWIAGRQLQLPDGAVLPERPVVFCALARPDGFVKMLRDAGVLPVTVWEFRDHHLYGEGDIDRLIELAGQHRADGFLTTEKDAVKLTAAMVERLESVGPVVVPPLRVELVSPDGAMREPDSAMRELMALIAAKRHSGA
jgi:tetraacyldisaccharide 4'-kinase